MNETRPDLRVALFVGGMAAVVLASVVGAASAGISAPILAVTFGVFIAVGELARVTLPGNREAAPLSSAGAMGYALLPSFAGATASYGALQVIAVAATAMAVGVLPHLIVGRTPSLEAICRQVFVTALTAAFFRATPLAGLSAGMSPAQLAIVLIVIVVAVLLMDAAIGALLRAGREIAPLVPSFIDELRAVGAIGSAVGATGVLIALAADFMGYWALPVFAVPLMLTQFAFRRYAAIRATYRQTIRSLSRVTELGGYTESGHARRVSRLSLAVGRELGMNEAQLLDLEYAALLHDLGQLSLADPIPGGATVVAPPLLQQQIAGYGAQVIRQTGVLDAVAEIVDKQAAPYRQAHQLEDGSVPLASRIIRAVNAYDDLVADSVEPGARRQAVERLRLDMAYEYDPRVVDVLSRVVERSWRRR